MQELHHQTRSLMLSAWLLSCTKMLSEFNQDIVQTHSFLWLVIFHPAAVTHFTHYQLCPLTLRSLLLWALSCLFSILLAVYTGWDFLVPQEFYAWLFEQLPKFLPKQLHNPTFWPPVHAFPLPHPWQHLLFSTLLLATTVGEAISYWGIGLCFPSD